MPRYLAKDIHDKIIDLHKQGKNFSVISRELGIAVSTVSNIIKKELPLEERLPQLPGGFDSIEVAYSICTSCRSMGYESPAAGAMCRQYKVDIREVKELARWFANNCTVNCHETIRELKSEVKLRDRIIEELHSDKLESDEVLAYLAKQSIKEQRSAEVKSLKSSLEKVRSNLEKEKNKVKFLKKVSAVMTDQS